MTVPAQRWCVRKVGQSQMAVVAADKLAELIGTGIVGSDHEVQLEGSTEWLTVAQATPFIIPAKPTTTPAKPTKPGSRRKTASSGRSHSSRKTAPPTGAISADKATAQGVGAAGTRWKQDESAPSFSPPDADSGPTESADSVSLPTLAPARHVRRRITVAGLDEDELDMTAMIDMTFLLLIFFMVTSTISPFADLQLPEANAGDAQKPEGRVVLVLDYDEKHHSSETPRYSGSEFIELKDCRLYLADDNQNRIPPNDLKEFLTEALTKTGGGEFILQSNRKMPVGVVREVIKIAKSAGAGETMIGVARPK